MTNLEKFMAEDQYMEHELHTEYNPKCSSCFAEQQICIDCKRPAIMRIAKAPELCGFCAHKKGIYDSNFRDAENTRKLFDLEKIEKGRTGLAQDY